MFLLLKILAISYSWYSLGTRQQGNSGVRVFLTIGYPLARARRRSFVTLPRCRSEPLLDVSLASSSTRRRKRGLLLRQRPVSPALQYLGKNISSLFDVIVHDHISASIFLVKAARLWCWIISSIRTVTRFMGPTNRELARRRWRAIQ
jgi:hypothetical protein